MLSSTAIDRLRKSTRERRFTALESCRDLPALRPFTGMAFQAHESEPLPFGEFDEATSAGTLPEPRSPRRLQMAKFQPTSHTVRRLRTPRKRQEPTSKSDVREHRREAWVPQHPPQKALSYSCSSVYHLPPEFTKTVGKRSLVERLLRLSMAVLLMIQGKLPAQREKLLMIQGIDEQEATTASLESLA
jgi:hypothetical protein